MGLEISQEKKDLLQRFSDDLKSAQAFDRLTPLVAPAKINLRLKLLGRRSDGYHQLRMLNRTAMLADELVVSLLPQSGCKVDEDSGELLADVPAEENLVSRAFLEFWRELVGVELHFSDLPFGFRCCIKKNIPTGAGLGGGSSDGAAVLKWLFSISLSSATKILKISEQDLMKRVSKVALTCGADLPYSFLASFCPSEIALVSGIGDEVDPLFGHNEKINLPKDSVIIVTPHTRVSTQDFFNHLRTRTPGLKTKSDLLLDSPRSVQAAIAKSGWDGVVCNDFEPFVCDLNPDTSRLLNTLREFFPLSTSVSGSGSSVFSIVPDSAVAHTIADQALKAVQNLPDLKSRVAGRFFWGA